MTNESYKSTNCENSSISPSDSATFASLPLTEIPRFLEESQIWGNSDDSVFPSLGKTTFKLLKIGEIRGISKISRPHPVAELFIPVERLTSFWQGSLVTGLPIRHIASWEDRWR